MNQNGQAKYFEKTLKESHINVFRSLEIENYLKQLLRKKGYTLHSYRLNFSNATIQIFVSAYHKTASSKKKITFKTRKTELLNKIKSENILKTIGHFTDNKFHVHLKILNLNSHNKLKTNLNISTFRVPNMEQLLPIITNQQGSASLLGTFMAEYLKTTKRHNFFFSSLSKNLNLILKQPDHQMKGIKIAIKGRLNNAARSQNKYIKVGSSPLITRNQNIDYSETTAYTPNGTIGIKIWVCHKRASNFLGNKLAKAQTFNARVKNL